MQRYVAAVKPGDARYIAWVPDLDLVLSGDRYWLYYDVRDAIEDRQARGEPMPTPSDVITLWERPDVRKWLAGDHGYLQPVSFDLEEYTGSDRDDTEARAFRVTPDEIHEIELIMEQQYDIAERYGFERDPDGMWLVHDAHRILAELPLEQAPHVPSPTFVEKMQLYVRMRLLSPI